MVSNGISRDAERWIGESMPLDGCDCRAAIGRFALVIVPSAICDVDGFISVPGDDCNCRAAIGRFALVMVSGPGFAGVRSLRCRSETARCTFRGVSGAAASGWFSRGNVCDDA
jgi:hypothetical protein